MTDDELSSICGPLQPGSACWIQDLAQHNFCAVGWCDVLGFEQEPNSFQQWLEGVHPDERNGIASVFNALGEGELEDFQLGIRAAAAGDFRHILLRAQTIRDADSRPTCVLVTSLDLMLICGLRAETGAVPNRFRSIADAAPILIWTTNMKGGSEWFNQNWLTFTGQTFESAMAKGRGAAVHPDDREPANSAFRAAQLLRDSIEQEYRLQHHRGTYRWMLERSAPLYDANGEFAGYVGVCLDISRDYELRRRSEEREEMMQHLNDISERERSFLSCAIHDGILQDIIGADMLIQAAEHLDSDRLKAKLDAARKSLHSALDHGRRLISELRPMILDEQGLVSAIEFYAAELQNRGTVEIQVTNNTTEEAISPFWSENVFRIVQAAMNNIEAHSQSATAKVEISQADGQLHIVVSDAGVGFDAEAASESFGLRCMRERAGLFGGTVLIASEIGQGCSVTIDIPLPPNG